MPGSAERSRAVGDQALTGIIDENGNWTYDSARRVTTNQSAGGADAITFGPYNYNVDTLNWITNALGEKFAYYFIGNNDKIKLRALGQAANGTIAGVAS